MGYIINNVDNFICLVKYIQAYKILSLKMNRKLENRDDSNHAELLFQFEE